MTAISEWLKAGGNFEGIANLERDWQNGVIQKYVIDMFPIGKMSNAYLHRNKSVISQNIAGIDFLDDAKQDLKYLAKGAKIEALAWEMWRGCLVLRVNKNSIMLTPPLAEVVELETQGKLSNPGSYSAEDTKIKVPVSFDENNQPKKFIEVWRGSASDTSLGYGNALGHVSFSTRNLKVLYGIGDGLIT